MTAFAWRFWRLGWARREYACIHGWQRVLGRLWWWTGRPLRGCAP